MMVIVAERLVVKTYKTEKALMTVKTIKLIFVARVSNIFIKKEAKIKEGNKK